MDDYSKDLNDVTKRIWYKKKYHSVEYYNDMVDKIAKAENDFKLVVFIGAGVSISQGYPNWDGYVDHLIKYWQFNIQSHVTSEKISRETILAFDLIAQSNNSNKRKIDLVHQILEDIFGEDFKNFKLEFEKYYFNDVPPFTPVNSILESLSDLNAIFITPNYDQELEKQLKRKKSNVQTINDLKEFSTKKRQLKINNVLHIHGTAEGDPDYLINSSAAYARLYFKNREYFEKLRKWFEKIKPIVLFIGVSLEEDELLSLLYEENENYALMRADTSTNVNVDTQFRGRIERFFSSKNHTKIFWYGDDFEELPDVVRDIVKNVRIKNKLPKQHEYLSKLTTTSTSNTEYVQILNTMIGNSKYHLDLNQLYDHIVKNGEKHMIDKLLENSLNSDIVLNKQSDIPESFWSLLDKEYDGLKEEKKESVIKLFLKPSFNPRNRDAYKIYKKMDLNSLQKNELVRSLSKNEIINYTIFSKEPDIMAEWLIFQFEQEDPYRYIFIKDEREVIFSFSEERCRLLYDTLQNSEYYEKVLYPINEMIQHGIARVFFQALKEQRIHFGNKPILECFPLKLLENNFIQKILVYMSSFITLPEQLVKNLFKKIDFNNKIFGSELNSFIEQNQKASEGIQIPYRGEYIDAIGPLQSFEDKSFITAEDVIKKETQFIVEKLINEKDYFIDNPTDGNGEMQTIEATVRFIVQSLKDNDQVSKKLEEIIISNSTQLIDRYEQLYLKIIAEKDIDTSLSEKAIKIYLDSININCYTNSYNNFFQIMSDRESDILDQVWNKFLEIDSSKLNYENDSDDILDISNLMNSELGIYVWQLLDLVAKKKIEIESAKQKIQDIQVAKIKEFAEGALYNSYSRETITETQNTFIGYCYFHQNIDKESSSRFRDIVMNIFNLGLDIEKMRIISFKIALLEINPADIDRNKIEGLDFRFMIRIIFTSFEEFPYEEKWLKWILKNGLKDTVLEEIGYLFSIKKEEVNTNKITKFSNKMEEYFTDGKSKISLPLIVNRLSNEDFMGDKSLSIDFIFSLLKTERVKTDTFFSEGINNLMCELKEEDKKTLLEIQYVKENLSKFDIDKLYSKIQ
ncbi:SIR2 family protein [Enterococcus hirae]